MTSEREDEEAESVEGGGGGVRGDLADDFRPMCL